MKLLRSGTPAAFIITIWAYVRNWHTKGSRCGANAVAVTKHFINTNQWVKRNRSRGPASIQIHRVIRHHRDWQSEFARIKRESGGISTRVGNHTFRATGVTAYLKNGGTLERAAQMSNHASTRTTQLYDRRTGEVTLDEVERVLI